MSRLRTYARFVKVEHSVFALPLLVSGVWLGSQGRLIPQVVFWVMIGGVAARVLAFALNRLIDQGIDALNPRTAGRELPSGEMTVTEAVLIGGAGAIVYLVAAAVISPVCLALSPIPIVVFAAYPYMKRFTWLAHAGVGVALSLAPLGGWAASVFSIPSASMSAWTMLRRDLLGDSLLQIPWLTAFTALWVAGFDIIYATLDEEFDRRQGLYSAPARFGRERALQISAGLHAAAFACVAALYLIWFRGVFSGILLAMIGGLLWWEGRQSQNVDLAFFKINGVISFVVFGFIWAGVAGH